MSAEDQAHDDARDQRVTLAELSEGEQFVGETFEGLKLAGGRVSRNDFEECRFVSCDLGEAYLDRCRFTDCEFRSSELSLLRPGASSFRDVRFLDCRAMGIDWTQAETALGFRALFERCILDSSSFAQLPLDELRVLECRAKDANFVGADLTRADFRGTNLMGSRFAHANLSEADLSNAREVMLDPATTTLQRTKLSLDDSIRVLRAMGIVVAGFADEDDAR